MKKKMLSLLLTFCMAVSLITAIPVTASADEYGEYGDLDYRIFNGEVRIIRCNRSAAGEIVIPDTIEGYPVTKIRSGAFHDCTGLTSVSIPDSVTYIDANTFENCTGLTSISIGNGVTTIGSWAFYGCTGLTNVSIPDSVTTIDRSAFNGCTKLTNISIGNGVTNIGYSAFEDCAYYNDESNWENGVLYIGNYLIKAKTSISGLYSIKENTKVIAYGAFYACTGLTNVLIPDSVITIGNSAFGGCNNLTSITIPDSVITIDWGAFENCGGLTSVTIGDSVTYIGDWAFNCCISLTSITIPDSVTYIGERAFTSCFDLANITIGNGVTTIGYGVFENCAYYDNESNWENGVLYIGNYLIKAKTSISGLYSVKENTKVIAGGTFEDCTGLTSISIPNSITNICYMAFYGCKGLTSVSIPDSVTYIDAHTFDSCTGLTSISIPNGITSIGAAAFRSCIGLTSITIPDSVTTIDRNAFEYCTKLTSVKIPNGVTYIDEYTFHGCTGLTSILIPNSVTEIRQYAFDGCSSLKTVYYYGGTEEDWNDIYIEDYNDPLKKANIDFSNPSSTKTVCVSAANGEKVFITTMNYIPYGARIILACYDSNGALVETQLAPNKGRTVYFVVTKEFTSAKVMAWESIDNIKPICAAERIK